MKNKFLTLNILISVFSLLILSSCIPIAIVGGAGALGYTAAQERSIGSAVDDASIETQIGALMISNKNRSKFSEVEIDSVEGRVLLAGTVKTREDKLEASKISWRAQGVREVINELQVSESAEFSATQVASDIWVTTQIESKILFAEGVSSINYSIETIDGIVYLMGVAKTREELEKVADIASRVSGVVRVVSYVRIKANETLHQTDENVITKTENTNYIQQRQSTGNVAGTVTGSAATSSSGAGYQGYQPRASVGEQSSEGDNGQTIEIID